MRNGNLLATRFAISAKAFGYLAIAGVSTSHEAEYEKVVSMDFFSNALGRHGRKADIGHIMTPSSFRR